MRIEYDREADALYIHLRDVPVGDNIDIEEGVTVDLDAQRHIVGITIPKPPNQNQGDEKRRLSMFRLFSVLSEPIP